MKRAIFLSSFFSTQFSGSKFLTSPAIWQSNALASNCVTRPTPLLPASRLRHTSSVPIPHPQTKPTPVTTTRRFKGKTSPVRISACRRGKHAALPYGRQEAELLACLGVLLDVFDGILHRGNLFGVLIGDFDAESFFEGHHELDRIERIGAEIVHERSGGCHFAFIHTELLDNNLLHAFFNAGHSEYSSSIGGLKIMRGSAALRRTACCSGIEPRLPKPFYA